MVLALHPIFRDRPNGLVFWDWSDTDLVIVRKNPSIGRLDCHGERREPAGLVTFVPVTPAEVGLIVTESLEPSCGPQATTS